MSERQVAPPSGMPPPVSAKLPDGVELDLLALAREVTERHLNRHPEDVERYGDLARQWGIHDTQHLLNWGALDVRGAVSLQEQVAWLANVLGSRGYPVPNLADNLDTCAEVTRERVVSAHAEALAAALESAARSVRERPSAGG